MEKLLRDLINRTDLLIKLQVFNGMRDMNQSQRVLALYGLGVAQSDIAAILSIPLNVVTSAVAKNTKRMRPKTKNAVEASS